MDVRPDWNGTQLKLVAHLKACAQWMPQQQQGFDLFMEKGVIINSRQQVVLYGPEHLRAYIGSSTLLGTFEDPSPVYSHNQAFVASLSSSDDSSGGAGPLVDGLAVSRTQRGSGL